MRTAVLALVVALVVVTAALAARGDPQKRIEPADQARAKAMVLRSADFSPAFTSRPNSSGSGGDFYCAALDESDLTLTGEALSPTFAATTEFATSNASVYESRTDSNASWARGTSAAGQRCLAAGLRRGFQGAAVRLVSFKRMSFPRSGQRSVAYRASLLTQQGLRAYVDVVVMQVSRAQVAVLYSSVLSPPPAGELRRLSGVVAKRAATAMRGA